jgi:putative MATE family efflux protein
MHGPQIDLTTGPITRTLIMFGLPTLGGNVLQSLNASLNAVWVGRLIGENALAAATNVNNVMFLTLAALFGFGLATTILVGQNMGRGNVDEVRKIVGTAVGMFLALSVALALIGWFGAPTMLHWLKTPPEALPLALGYFKIIFLAMPAIFMLTLAMMALRGTGDSVTPLIWMAVSVVLDSGLNPLLIAGIAPFPKMGIEGAAFATVIANYVCVLGLVIQLYMQDSVIRLRGAELGYLRPDPEIVRVIISKGIPMAMQMFVISGSAIIMISLINREGVLITAAYSVTMQLWTYIQMPAMAIGAAVSTMVAQNIGANKWDRVAAVTRSGIMISLIVTVSIVALLAIVDKPALGLFINMHSPAMPIAQHIQLLATWAFIMFGVTFVLLGTMRANGAVWVAVAILFISLYPMRIGIATGLHPWLGADAIWLSFPISSAVSMLLSGAFYLSGFWKRARMAPASIIGE